MPSEIPLIYFLQGDSLLIRSKADEILQKFRALCGGTVEEQSYYLSDTPLSQILIFAKNQAFLSSGQFFRIRDFEKLNNTDCEMLAVYAERPASATVLCFESSIEKFPAELAKKIVQIGDLIKLETSDKGSVLGRYIATRLAAAGKTIEPQGAALLERSAGEMPSLLETMLDKLISYSGEKKQVTAAMVELFYEDYATRNIFDLGKAITGGHPEAGLEILSALIEDYGKDFPSLVGTLHWHLRRLWQYTALSEDGIPSGEALKRSGFYGKEAAWMARQPKRYSRLKLEKALEGLFRLDWDIKSGQAGAQTAIESWLVAASS